MNSLVGIFVSNRKAEMAREKASLPVVTSQQEYDALESGDKYIGKDGQLYEKP